jgi:endonuclease YncB( thermonuclease family)
MLDKLKELGSSLANAPKQVAAVGAGAIAAAVLAVNMVGTNGPTYKVLSVADGDTIKVQSPNGSVTSVRFCAVDAPEKAQPGGVEARAALVSLIEKGKGQVSLTEVGKDKYSRTVAEVFTGGVFAQEELARQGLVYFYEQYSKSCPNWQKLKAAEDEARRAKIGVWADPNAIKPWDWRKAKAAKIRPQ